MHSIENEYEYARSNKVVKNDIISNYSSDEIDKAVNDYIFLGSIVCDYLCNNSCCYSGTLDLLTPTELRNYLNAISIDNSNYFGRVYFLKKLYAKDFENSNFEFLGKLSYFEQILFFKISSFNYGHSPTLKLRFLKSNDALETTILDSKISKIDAKWYECEERLAKLKQISSNNHINAYFDMLQESIPPLLHGHPKNVYSLKNKRMDLIQKSHGFEFGIVYNALLKSKKYLDADSCFYWHTYSTTEEIISIAKNFVSNQDHYNNRYKSVSMLINADFDYSFCYFTNAINSRIFHKNEKLNFYKSLARLNIDRNPSITQKQIFIANDYLKQQQENEEDILIRLDLDFIRAITIKKYGLSKERILFLQSLNKNKELDDEIKQIINRRLIFINLARERYKYKTFLDFYIWGSIKNNIQQNLIPNLNYEFENIPIFQSLVDNNIWDYYEINFEAYIAYNTNKYTSSNLVIPNTIDNYPVVGITDEAFVDSQGCITNIIVPNTVRKIGAHAFAHNTNLWSIAIPSSVTDIGQDVFKKSTNLKKIYLEEGSSLTDECFYDSYHVNLHPNCKIIRTKFENGLPIVPPKSENNN